MIYEYALDPYLLNNWERWRYLTERFGVSQGRLISRYPKRWRRMVYEALESCTEIERLKIVEKLKSIDDRLITRIHEWADGDWLVNAESENAKRPFRAIISADNPRAVANVLVADGLDEDTTLWKIESEVKVNRQADELGKALAPLLKLGRRLVFIDPYFDPNKPKVRNTLKVFLAVAVTRNNETPIEEIEFHTKYRPEIVNFREECFSQLPKRIPAGLKVKVIRWKEKEGGEGLHNRYILTERGGVRLAWGLDEGIPSHTDDISLLQPGMFAQTWALYCESEGAFDLHDELIIEGIA